MPFDTSSFLTDAENAGGALVGAVGQYEFGQSHLQFGVNQLASMKFQAQQLMDNAHTVQGTSQIAAWQQRQQTATVLSNQRAAAAGDGGSATDPSVIQIMGRTAGRGAMNALQDLATGQERARTMQMQAEGDIYSGELGMQQAQRIASSADISAFGSMIKPTQTLFSKYGAGSPAPMQGVGDNGYQSGGALFGNVNPFAPPPEE